VTETQRLGGSAVPSNPDGTLGSALAGLDELELPLVPKRPPIARLWSAAWPKLAAIAVALAIWELVAISGWRPSYLLPGPIDVLARVFNDFTNPDGQLISAIFTTMRRALAGFAIAMGIGLAVGLAVVRSRRLRAAIGASITGLQTMPSIAWFPLAILLFGLDETAILFVVVLGAAPAVANGMIAGADHIPRILLRAAQVLGAHGIALYREVILPACVPYLVGGMKQAWAFAWRSLMAGELLVIIAAQPALGVRLQQSRDVSDAEGLLASMLVILVIGIAVDGLFFSWLDRRVRRRWGLLEDGV